MIGCLQPSLRVHGQANVSSKEKAQHAVVVHCVLLSSCRDGGIN